MIPPSSDFARESFGISRAPANARGPSRWIQQIYYWLPALSFLYASVLFPLLSLAAPTDTLESRVEHRIFWPAMAAASLLIATLVLKSRPMPRLSALTICILVYLLLASLSISWSPTPDVAAKRVLQEVFVIFATMVPIIVTSDRGSFFDKLLHCFVIGSVVNLLFVVIRPPTELGHAGIYTQKNVLGQFAALAFLFSLNYWTLIRRRHFFCGVFVSAAALVLLVLSQSKTSLVLSLGAPVIAGCGLLLSRSLGVSPRVAILLLATLASLTGFLVADALNIGFEDLSLALFNDVTFTGRTFIWSFASEMAERRPMLGWGYQSFWLVGTNAPSVVEAPGFVAIMPHAHNGYLDVKLETGWLGLAVVSLMILSALSGAGALRNAYSRRSWVTLSIVLFMIVYNMMESSWTRGFDLAWLMFLIVAGDINSDTHATADGRASATPIPSDRWPSSA